ncbi:MAG TPA: cell wall hydrolase [Allosphingosinicella sp.]|nr:cell wall hydrolase [Allosphingosinicella sp.]
MALSVSRVVRSFKRHRLAVWAPLALLLPAASCVPAGIASAPVPELSRAEIAAFTAPLPAAATAQQKTPGFSFLIGDQAFAANAAIPVFSGPNPAAGAYVFNARTPLDQMRSVDCLAQAVYYEARSESEGGQRAVAQVVLNRVRHPAWPDSVCGVVYQGPMRPGGGCQFTFTCDGSLAIRPSGPGWDAAQRIAAEALGGRTYDPVGLATHYHTSAVFPAWAPRLIKIGVIGAHNFYRLPGLAGAPGAFDEAYAGREPLPRPAMTLIARPSVAPVPIFAAAGAVPAVIARPVSDIAPDPRWTSSNLPTSTVREEHAQSGQWRDDAPAAITGR